MKRSIERKPKLLYMITKANWGGAQKYVFELATNTLIRKDYTVSVLTGSSGELCDKLRSKGVKTNTLEVKNSINPFSTIFEIKKMVSFLKKEAPTIIHINSSKMALIASIAGKLAGVPHIVFTAHNWTFTERRPLYVRIPLHLAFYLVVYLADSTICVAESVKQSLRAPSFLRKKMVVIYNGVEPASIEKITKLSIGSNIRHIVSVGELHPNKGQDTVISLLPFIENIHYHIIGEGKMRQKLESMIASKHLEKRVTLYGHRANAQSLLPQYDLFILPSRTEALPYVVLEALQAGLPIIARAVGGVPEIVKDIYSATTYTHDNELIHLLKKDLPEVKPWRDNRFSIDNMIRKTAYEYETLLENN